MDKANHRFAFQKLNYKILLVGLAINVLGFILMIGGESPDPTKFNASELFSPVRITVAPILIIAGYLVMIYAIMKKPKNTNVSDETNK
ncbi:MAG: DUF3098 domain-containing protein [Crocinitomicaceae bacterium]|nr:DUF3098 domain-containing protein [Crocinitomicaceae bacterium]